MRRIMKEKWKRKKKYRRIENFGQVGVGMKYG